MNQDTAAIVTKLRNLGYLTATADNVLAMAEYSHDLDFEEIERIIEVNGRLRNFFRTSGSHWAVSAKKVNKANGAPGLHF